MAGTSHTRNISLVFVALIILVMINEPLSRDELFRLWMNAAYKTGVDVIEPGIFETLVDLVVCEFVV